MDIAAIAINHDDSWFFLKDINRLYYKNLKTGEVSLCGSVPWENELEDELYRGIEYSNGKLYLLPYRAREIAVYDVKKRLFRRLLLDVNYCEGKKLLFMACCKYKDDVIAYGVHSHAIISINTINDEIRYYTEWFANVSKYLSIPHGILSRKQLCIDKGIVYWPLHYGNIVVSLDLKSKEINYIKYEGNYGKTSGINVRNGKLYICKEKVVLEISLNTGIANVTGYYNKFAEVKAVFLEFTENEVVLLASDSSKLNILDGNLRLCSGEFECIASNCDGNVYWNKATGEIIRISGDEYTKHNFDIDVSNEEFNHIFSGKAKEESSCFGLKEFIEVL